MHLYMCSHTDDDYASHWCTGPHYLSSLHDGGPHGNRTSKRFAHLVNLWRPYNLCVSIQTVQALERFYPAWMHRLLIFRACLLCFSGAGYVVASLSVWTRARMWNTPVQTAKMSFAFTNEFNDERSKICHLYTLYGSLTLWNTIELMHN